MCQQYVEVPAKCTRWWCEWDQREDGTQVHIFRAGPKEYVIEGAEHIGTIRMGTRLDTALNELLRPVDPI
jgi:hypothetical protein